MEIDQRLQDRRAGQLPQCSGLWNGPAWFKVWTKSGQSLLRFRRPTQSRSEGRDPSLAYQDGDTGVAWYLFRHYEDRHGNYATIQYEKTQTTGDPLPGPNQDVDHRPVAITYTGNSAAGQAPYAKVTFDYETRPDAYKGFLGGVRMDNQYRLTSIKTWINADTTPTLVNDYRLGYVQSSQSGRSLLNTLTLCDGSGSCSTSNSLPATTFAYQQRTSGDNAFSSVGFTGPTPNWTSRGPNIRDVLTDIGFGDFDGDGRIDMIQWDRTASAWKVNRAPGTGLPAEVWPGPHYKADGITPIQGTKDVLFGDFDGDGRTDIAIPPATDSSGNWTVCLSSGSSATGFVCRSWFGNGSWASPGNYIVGDFDGDGRDDIAMVATLSHGETLCRSLGSVFSCVPYPNVAQAKGATYLEDQRVFTTSGDFNGDGRTDVAMWNAGPAYYFNLCLAGDSPAGFDCNTTVTPPVTSDQLMHIQVPTFNGGSMTGDLGGDGYTDIVATFVSATPAGNFCRATGTTLACTALSASLPSDFNTTIVADFDGDGRPDSLHFDGTLGQWRVCQLAAGAAANSYGCSSWGNWPTPTELNFNIMGPIAFDFNGDGKADLAFYNSATGQWTIAYAGGGSRPDLLSTVTDGYQAAARFDYDRLTTATAGFYQKDTAAFSYPIRDVSDSSYVVKTMHRDNGAGSSFDTTYSYYGLKADVSGRGSLGFRSIESIDSTTGIKTHVDYAQQAYPYTGMVTGIVETLGTTTLHTLGNTLTSQAGSGAGTLFPYVGTSTETRNDLDAYPVSTTETYGSIPGVPITYSTYGVATDSTTRVTVGSDQRSTRLQHALYAADTTNWFVDQIQQTTITKTGPTAPTSVTRVVSFTYDAYGSLYQETVEPGTGRQVVTTYDRSSNPWGLVNKKTIAWTDPRSGYLTRDVETVVAFESKGRYASQVKNAALPVQQTIIGQDVRFGAVSSIQDPNYLVTSYAYDAFGRRVSETRPDQTSVRPTTARSQTAAQTAAPVACRFRASSYREICPARRR